MNPLSSGERGLYSSYLLSSFGVAVRNCFGKSFVHFLLSIHRLASLTAHMALEYCDCMVIIRYNLEHFSLSGNSAEVQSSIFSTVRSFELLSMISVI